MDYNLLQQKNEEYIMDGGTFDSLKLEFQRVLTELRSDPHVLDLEPFIREYAKLQSTLLKSHENEKRLFRKSEEQNRRILSLTQTIKDGLRRQKDDQLMIEALEQEVKDAWTKVQGSHLRETKQKDYLAQLKREVDVLKKLLKHGLSIQSSSKQRISVLEDERNALADRIQSVDEEVNGLIKEVAFQRNKISELTTQKETIDRRAAFLDLEMKKRELEYEDQKKLRLQREDELKETRDAVKAQLDVVAGLKESQRSLDLEIEQLKTETDTHLRSAQEEHERSIALMRQRNELKDIVEAHDEENAQLKLKTSNLRERLRAKQTEVSTITKKLDRVLRDATHVRAQWEEVNARKAVIENERDEVYQSVQTTSRELDNLKRAADRDKTRVDDLTHQRNILVKNVAQKGRQTEASESRLAIETNRASHEQRKKRSHRAQALMQRKALYTLEREISRYQSQTAEATQKTKLACEEIEVNLEQRALLERTIDGLKLKRKNTTALCDTVEHDRNRHVKTQQRYLELIANSRKAFRFIQKGIQQLKEETKATDKKIQSEYIEVENSKKKSDSLKNLLEQKALVIKRKEQELARSRTEMTKLSHILREAEEERLSQQNEIETVTNDRDVLSQQLIKRNAEMSKLLQKISVQQNHINLARSEFDEHGSNVELLQTKIRELRLKKEELSDQLQILPQTEKDMHRLRRQLLGERSRIRALQDELGTTLNVHRWRKIEGSQPKLFHLIERFHSLQRQLIKKNEEIIGKDLLIQEKERLYTELKNLILKQPGAEVSEQVQLYKQQLRTKIKGRRNLETELKNQRNLVSVGQEEGRCLEEEILRMKEEYFRRKKVQYEPPENFRPPGPILEEEFDRGEEEEVND